MISLGLSWLGVPRRWRDVIGGADLRPSGSQLANPLRRARGIYETVFRFLYKNPRHAKTAGAAVPVSKDVSVLWLDYAARPTSLSGVRQIVQHGSGRTEGSETRRM